MRKTELPNCPQWLLDARTYREDVAWNSEQHQYVIWLGGVFSGGVFSGGEFRGGVFRGGKFRGGVFSGGEFRGGVFSGGEFRGGEFSGGEFRGGEFSGGEFRGGVFSGGVFRGGEFSGGVFRGGEFSGGEFRGGVFSGGKFRGGVFSGGEWTAPENRLLYMAAMLGIVFDSDGYATAYRSTHASGRGRHTRQFIQPEGEFFEPNCARAGAGTCSPGIHVSSAVIAYTYFGIDRSAQLWRVKFHRDDLLDCDGEKARIRGGHFAKIPWPFLPEGEK